MAVASLKGPLTRPWGMPRPRGSSDNTTASGATPSLPAPRRVSTSMTSVAPAPVASASMAGAQRGPLALGPGSGPRASAGAPRAP
eukprot:5499850-Lingulodinium_polyedra.AAC.1